jgi:hypothetical protein
MRVTGLSGIRRIKFWRNSGKIVIFKAKMGIKTFIDYLNYSCLDIDPTNTVHQY